MAADDSKVLSFVGSDTLSGDIVSKSKWTQTYDYQSGTVHLGKFQLARIFLRNFPGNQDIHQTPTKNTEGFKLDPEGDHSTTDLAGRSRGCKVQVQLGFMWADQLALHQLTAGGLFRQFRAVLLKWEASLTSARSVLWVI